MLEKTIRNHWKACIQHSMTHNSTNERITVDHLQINYMKQKRKCTSCSIKISLWCGTNALNMCLKDRKALEIGTKKRLCLAFTGPMQVMILHPMWQNNRQGEFHPLMWAVTWISSLQWIVQKMFFCNGKLLHCVEQQEDLIQKFISQAQGSFLLNSSLLSDYESLKMHYETLH